MGEANQPETMTCWCGAEGKYEELFATDSIDTRCQGSGILYCHCGGDLCVCHYHGEEDCPGCPDCEPDDGYKNDDYDW